MPQLYKDYLPANRLRREVNYIYQSPLNPPSPVQSPGDGDLQNVSLLLGIGASAVTILSFIFGRK